MSKPTKNKAHGLIGKVNNPDGKPSRYGPTEMVSKRLPVALMNRVRLKNKNVTEFIRLALEEKLQKPD
jgi:hypothetical protein